MPGAYGDLLGRYFELPSVPALVMLPAPKAPFVATRITCLPDTDRERLHADLLAFIDS